MNNGGVARVSPHWNCCVVFLGWITLGMAKNEQAKEPTPLDGVSALEKLR
jgi:hypothetical protein